MIHTCRSASEFVSTRITELAWVGSIVVAHVIDFALGDDSDIDV